MAKELEKNYNPADIEQRLYDKWENNKYFHAEVDRSKKPFTIVMPPPNITGQLHMGHALDNTIQDILIRTKRMQGYEALWVPGTDHASIATEAKIVEKMREEGVTKEDLGREKFLDRAWEWKKQYGGRIVAQLKKIGSSCDWDRERFTMDEGCNKAVKEVFINLYNKGLIYRGERIINWCPKCLTSISDAEVNYEDQAGHFWHLRYPLSDGSGYINLATTRPETLLGDTAVAVNPKDGRYKDMIGKTVILPIVHREIPIIADDYVEMEFGTGVVKITPAHDPNDFEVGLRHDLEIINVMTEDAKIVEDYPKYAGMDRYEARKAIVADLEAEGALVKVEDYSHNVGTCYRCKTTVEPRVSKQWFVKMEPLAKPAIEAVKNGDTQFIPPHFDKTYFHWLEGIRDWCISRQLWWGHRIPAFYCDDCGEMAVTKEQEALCPKCGKKMRQDPDTLDTWFSSALWPFSTLGWPDKTEELDYFYPTSTLVTGYDIIFFWVIRMVFSGLEHVGKVPFHTVLIHGLVRDSQGRKMSKSLGNGIDPLEVIEKYGADALRFTLITGNAPGNDMRFYYERVEASPSPVNRWEKRMEEYLNTLFRELKFLGEVFQGRKLNTIYVGGGTPTTLTAEQLNRLLDCLEKHFDYSYLKELTVEAGRPDSVTSEKFRVLKRHGVTRVSVNPQTMNQKTLDLIGRQHTVEQTREAYWMAREAGFDNINMDLIVGLPGEDLEEVRRTMEELRVLDPDSITVHSLAIKRAARLKLFQEKYQKMGLHNSQEIMDLTYRYCAEQQVYPYYLYRQKNIAGNFENVGYAKVDKAGIYNILIMEEKQTILAAGAGGASKFVLRPDRIERVENVKDVAQYMARIDEMMERKRSFLKASDLW